MKLQLHGTQVQRDLCTATQRYLAIFAGRRYGKTFSLLNYIITNSLQDPGHKTWYVSPVYAQCWEQFERIAFAPFLDPYIAQTRQKPIPLITFKNGSTVAMRSWERPRNLRGSGLDSVLVDEIQDIDEQYFWPVIRPLISDRRGRLVIAGQFRGFNWYYKEFYLKGQDKKYAKTHKSWRCPSSMGLVYQSQEGREELALAKSSIPKAVWDQEYDCIPSANQQAVFRPEDLQACTGGKAYKKAGVGTRNIIGLDLGRVADPSAVVVLNLDKQAILHAELRPLKERHEITAKAVARLQRDFGMCPVVIDVTGGATGGRAPVDAYVKFYRESVSNLREFNWTASNKERVIQHLSVAIEQHHLKIPKACTELLDQLGLYEYEYRRGRYDYHGPSGHKDDLVAALAMAWYGHIKKWGARRDGAPLGAVL